MPSESQQREMTPLQLDRPFLPTRQAAHLLGRRMRTLHLWAMAGEKAPIKPRRVAGRLMWPVAEITRLLGVAK